MLSIVVPMYNEQAAVPAFLEMARRWEEPCELVVADGGSTDATVEMLEAGGVRVVRGAKGRGAQCNLGVCASSGDAVLFLHADVSVGPQVPGHVRAALEKGCEWGCLTLRWARKGAVWRIGEWASNRRVRRAGVPFGDQGVFMTRRLLDEVGGVPDLPIMEDYELALRLRARGLFPKQLPDEVWADPRRFVEGGPVRTALFMRRLRKMYRAGADPAELATLYRDVR